MSSLTAISCSPNFGSSRKVLKGQRIHSSFVLAQTTPPYTPKASPPNNDPDFWADLRKDGVQNTNNLLEINIFDYATAQRIMRMFMHEDANLPVECLQRIAKEGKMVFGFDYFELELMKL
jgi:hypothetical protein